LKSGLKSAKNIQKLKIQAIWRSFNMKTFLLFYFIYLFNFKKLFLI
jgi:hypothetical protein